MKRNPMLALVTNPANGEIVRTCPCKAAALKLGRQLQARGYRVTGKPKGGKWEVRANPPHAWHVAQYKRYEDRLADDLKAGHDAADYWQGAASAEGRAVAYRANPSEWEEEVEAGRMVDRLPPEVIDRVIGGLYVESNVHALEVLKKDPEAAALLREMKKNPGRPTSEFMRRCEQGVGKGYDPGAVCAAQWHRMSPAQKRKWLSRENPRDLSSLSDEDLYKARKALHAHIREAMGGAFDWPTLYASMPQAAAEWRALSDEDYARHRRNPGSAYHRARMIEEKRLRDADRDEADAARREGMIEREAELLNSAERHDCVATTQFEDMMESAREGLAQKLAMRANPVRPPKKWWDDCTAGVGKGYDPRRVCGDEWYHKMTESERRAARRRHERNPGIGNGGAYGTFPYLLLDVVKHSGRGSDYSRWLGVPDNQVGIVVERAHANVYRFQSARLLVAAINKAVGSESGVTFKAAWNRVPAYKIGEILSEARYEVHGGRSNPGIDPVAGAYRAGDRPPERRSPKAASRKPKAGGSEFRSLRDAALARRAKKNPIPASIEVAEARKIKGVTEGMLGQKKFWDALAKYREFHGCWPTSISKRDIKGVGEPRQQEFLVNMGKALDVSYKPTAAQKGSNKAGSAWLHEFNENGNPDDLSKLPDRLCTADGKTIITHGGKFAVKDWVRG